MTTAGTSVQARWPQFLVIGAGRAGTTSLQRYLARHPQLFLPAGKAPSYWYATARPSTTGLPRTFVRSEAAYSALFAPSRDDQLRGEVSPVYLAATDVAARVADRLPDVRVIAILRHPVDRVYARWVARRRDGLEPTATFEALIEQESRDPLVRDDAHATYLAGGVVSPMLRTWFESVPDDRRLMLWFEDFAANTSASMQAVCRFLGVRDDVDLGTTQRHNASGGRIRHPLVRGVWAASHPLRRMVRPLVPQGVRDAAFAAATRHVEPQPLAPATRAHLTALYQDEIRALATLTGRNLEHWLEPASGTSR